MQLGLVFGKAIATMKDPTLHGQRLLAVQPLMADGHSPDGFPLLVVDTVGAGVGERVMISSDGKGAREYLGTDKTPVRWTTIGIQDP